jgi:hypothetical protein
MIRIDFFIISSTFFLQKKKVAKKSCPKIQPDGLCCPHANATFGPKPSGSHIFGVASAP